MRTLAGASTWKGILIITVTLAGVCIPGDLRFHGPPPPAVTLLSRLPPQSNLGGASGPSEQDAKLTWDWPLTPWAVVPFPRCSKKPQSLWGMGVVRLGSRFGLTLSAPAPAGTQFTQLKETHREGTECLLRDVSPGGALVWTLLNPQPGM